MENFRKSQEYQDGLRISEAQARQKIQEIKNRPGYRTSDEAQEIFAQQDIIFRIEMLRAKPFGSASHGN